MSFALRNATAADCHALQRIYAHEVLHGVGTFEETPPSADEMERRRATYVAKRFPYLVAEADHTVVGFAYVSPFRERSAYRFTVEDSVYIAPEWQGKGVGRALLHRLIEECTGLGFRQMLAVIGGTSNTGSISLHTRLGFQRMGALENVGLKFGEWVGVVLMQRDLGVGASTLP